jgi:hypothetical protein
VQFAETRTELLSEEVVQGCFALSFAVCFMPHFVVAAIVLRPMDTNAPPPFIMMRLPYGADQVTLAFLWSQFTELAQSGYIFVIEDIRRRFESEGEFVMTRPLAAHHDPQSTDPRNIDESTDSYDTVKWIVKNIQDNNGRVGFDLKDTTSFQIGSNRWMHYSHWPPKLGIVNRNLYLGADGR